MNSNTYSFFGQGGRGVRGKNIKVGNSVVHITRPVVFPYKLDPILPSHLFYLQDRPFLVPFDNLGNEAGARAIFISRHVAKSLAAWEAIRGQQGEQGDVLWDQVDGVRSPKTIKKAFQDGQTVTKCNL